jgi:protein-S-isoprenylcysteine O-methyltransferase Ste14
MQDSHRALNAISRTLFAIWMLDEGRAFQKRNDPEVTSTGSPTPWTLLLILTPLIWPLRLPRSLRIAGIILQLIGLLVTLGARRQLIAANSFGWSAEAATQPQQVGFYRYLEHPIYGSVLLQMIGLGAANPLILLIPALSLRDTAQLISNERRFLEQLGVVHRGADSLYWDFAIAATGATR